MHRIGACFRQTVLMSLMAALLVPAAALAGAPIGGRFLIQNDTTPSEIQPAVAYNPVRQEYLVVWHIEYLASPIKEVWGRRVSRTGALLSPAFRISPENGGYNPDVAYNSAADQYLVVYETGSNIEGQRVLATGALVGSEIDIAVGYVHGSFHYTRPAVDYASTANRYLVALRYISDLDNSSSIQARAYTSNGLQEDYAFEVCPYVSAPDNKFPDRPDLAYNRSRNEFLVIWQQEYSSTDHDIYARRIAATGAVTPTGSIFAITTSANDDVTPAVAAIPTVPDAGQYLVVWEASQNIHYKTVTGTGTPGTLQSLASTAWGEHTPAAAGCESNQEFLAVWQWVPSPTPPGMMQLQGRAVALNGTLLGPGTVTMSGQQVYNPAVANGPAGDMLVAFDDTDWSGGTPLRGVYGQFWGNRAFLPLVLRNH
ncbi:MAG: hypothetical protein KKA73_25095 [Chloroflexi bacterium]|nr:hypothetical protein [Chloroflexota bacterium]MBU1750974.1 hypothetical protein [Chloroflexota bacterium]MBU1877397.1 hypothetical protein [Chloroflexota bacterium]